MKLKKYQKHLIWRLNPKKAKEIIYFIENYIVIYEK